MIPVVILAAVGGLIYGSFLNVLLWRLPEGKGIGGRSQCRNCHHTLAWHDLIPVLSFFLLARRCRYCRRSIHWRYPVVEAATAIALALLVSFRAFGSTTETILLIAATLILVSLLFFDLFYFILPDVILAPAIIVWAVYDWFFAADPLLVFMVGLLMASFFAILYWISRGKQLGFGDVKLVLYIGLVLGYPLGVVSVIGGVWLAAIVAILLLLAGRLTRKDAIPLGSFLALTALLCLIFQHEITFFTRLFI